MTGCPNTLRLHLILSVTSSFRVTALARISYPYPLEYLESNTLIEVQRILTGYQLYPAPGVGYVPDGYPRGRLPHQAERPRRRRRGARRAGGRPATAVGPRRRAGLAGRGDLCRGPRDQHARAGASQPWFSGGRRLSPDQGYPARVIVPANPCVHNTKWVASLTFGTTTCC
jgi:hypothetical protein